MDKVVLIPNSPMYASQLVEIPIANAASAAVIPDQPQLRNQNNEIIVVKSIRLITPKVLTHAPTSGTAITPLADLKKISLLLYADGWEKGRLIPLLTLNDVQDSDSTAATTIPFMLGKTSLADWENIDWNKSSLVFSNGLTASIASVCVFQVEYQKYYIREGQRVLVK